MTKKYARTTIKIDGEYITARLNLETGEIKPYNYPQGKQLLKSRASADHKPITDFSLPGDLLNYIPHWATIATDSRCFTTLKGKTVIARKSTPNRNKVFVDHFEDLNEAIDTIPFLDDILTGVANLDYGNDTPLARGKLFHLLQNCEEITTAAVYEATGHSEAHCYRLAQFMRILVTAFNTEVER